jgi:hypothetical protein
MKFHGKFYEKNPSNVFVGFHGIQFQWNSMEFRELTEFDGIRFRQGSAIVFKQIILTRMIFSIAHKGARVTPDTSRNMHFNVLLTLHRLWEVSWCHLELTGKLPISASNVVSVLKCSNC